MIKSITVTNHLGESIELELGCPEKSGLLIQNITGLSPSRANINTTDLSNNDGSIFNSSRVQSRNIVLTLVLLSTTSIETIRQMVYKYFPIKKRIKFLIETDNRICETYGYIESNEIELFSKKETAQISIICPDPYFYLAGDDGTNISIFHGITPIFQFQFSNESLTEKVIEFGSIINMTENTIYYEGDADVGVVITINSNGTATNVSIYNNRTQDIMRIDTVKLETLTGDTIIDKDVITISTVKGNKYVTLLRNGIYYNILNCLDKDADWLQLSKGDNIFAYAAETGIGNLQFRVENQIVYEGV